MRHSSNTAIFRDRERFVVTGEVLANEFPRSKLPVYDGYGYNDHDVPEPLYLPQHGLDRLPVDAVFSSSDWQVMQIEGDWFNRLFSEEVRDLRVAIRLKALLSGLPV